jgi:hypothetical protein
MRILFPVLLLLTALTLIPAHAAAPSLQTGTVMEAAERLKPGEYLWAPDIAPKGPVLLVVSLATQRAVVYRNGVPIGISTVSTGRPGYRTPTGVFVILQKHVEHYSNLYDNAPMPYMQRLTWGGVALHGGNLPGYPASHGCIRLPHEFAKLLYQVTHHGMTVIVTERTAVPRIAPADEMLHGRDVKGMLSSASVDWHPQRAPAGPVSVMLSSADQRAVVVRNGVVIGSAPIEIQGPIERTSAFLLDGVDDKGRVWVRIGLPGQAEEAPGEALRDRIRVPDEFRRLVDPIITIGATVIVTGDSLQSDATGRPMTVIEADDGAPKIE